MPQTHVNGAFYLLSVNDFFPPIVVRNGDGNMMTERFEWISHVLQDLENFCKENGLNSVSREFARIRPKINSQILEYENEHMAPPPKREQETNAY